MLNKNYFKETEYIHYSNCHEDASVLLNNAPKNPKNILSIASALDNSLAMLLLNPEYILAIDSNITQIYLCQLKKTAIERLEYEEFLVFYGIKEGDSLFYYEIVKPYLEQETRRYFDEHLYLIRSIKLIHCGRFEYYFQVFKNKVLIKIHRQKTINQFMNFNDLASQRSFYKKRFDNLRFRLMFKVFFSKRVMKKIGRDKDYFKYSKGNLSKILKQRFDFGVEHNLNKDNPYLQYVIFNQFQTLPAYLRKDNYEIIKKRISLLEIRFSSFEEIMEQTQTFDYMNLSDIFEYMSKEQTDQLEKKIYDHLNEDGKIVFFNMMIPRSFNRYLSGGEISQRHDLAFYYMKDYCYHK